MDWNETYIHISITTGMDIETVRDQFDLHRLESFNTYTKKFPPQHLLAASYFGYTGKTQQDQKEADIAELLANIPMVPQ